MVVSRKRQTGAERRCRPLPDDTTQGETPVAKSPVAIDSIPDVLQFRPRWWWDPAPPWLVTQLDKNILIELARVQMQLQKEVLAAEQKAIDASLAVLGKARG